MRQATRYIHRLEGNRVCRIDHAVQVLQRIYKYGGQPFARDYLALHFGSDFDRTFGKGTGKAIMHATAGRYRPRHVILLQMQALIWSV